MQSFVHQTVLRHEAVDALKPKSGGHYVDCTLGGAGHSELILNRTSPEGLVLAFDQDPVAVAYAREHLAAYGRRFTVVHTNFRNVAETVRSHDFAPVDGVLFDLGVSSVQFDDADRGFSYRFDAELDMRMDPEQELTAKVLVNELDESKLAKLFFEYGEEKFSRRIARAIVNHRQDGTIHSTAELADIVKQAIPAPARRSGPHPARRVFQALRIAVNDELGALEEALDGAFSVLAPGGRMAVITFHSLEDRIVKHRFQKWSQGCICPPDFPVCQCHRVPEAVMVTRKPILPSSDELAANSRSKSAKLRVAEKCTEAKDTHENLY